MLAETKKKWKPLWYEQYDYHYSIAMKSTEGIEKQLRDAEVNHGLSFGQVSDNVICQYKILKGHFDTMTECKYIIPSFMDIGKLYSIMMEDCAQPGKEVDELIKIFFFYKW